MSRDAIASVAHAHGSQPARFTTTQSVDAVQLRSKPVGSTVGPTGFAATGSAGRGGGFVLALSDDELHAAVSSSSNTTRNIEQVYTLRAMPSGLEGISILVLEDDRDTMELFAGSLRKLGGDVRAASTAAAALEILAAWKPTVVLCDLHLAGTDGYAFLASLRELDDHLTTPVIAISASHPVVERERALQAGFAEYVVKPTRISEIAAVIATCTTSA